MSHVGHPYCNDHSLVFGIKAELSERILYLAVKQLRLQGSSSLYVKANFVEQSYRVLLLIQTPKLSNHLSGPSCKHKHTHTHTIQLNLRKCFMMKEKKKPEFGLQNKLKGPVFLYKLYC